MHGVNRAPSGPIAAASASACTTSRLASVVLGAGKGRATKKDATSHSSATFSQHIRSRCEQKWPFFLNAAIFHAVPFSLTGGTGVAAVCPLIASLVLDAVRDISSSSPFAFDMSNNHGSHVVPTEVAQSKLKACMSCSLIKTTQQFYTDGCDNCDFMSLAGDKERISACTTSQFVG